MAEKDGAVVETPDTLAKALVAVQSELPKLEKAALNPHFKSKYISLDTIMAEVLPIVNRHGLAWVTEPGYDGEELVLTYGVIHAASGEERFCTMKLLAAKDDPQGQGAAITYARRYSITSFFGISADEDDDGNRATASRQASRQRAQEARSAPVLLDTDQLASMTTAIREKGLDVADTLTQAGIEEPLKVTAAQAKAVQAILERVE